MTDGRSGFTLAELAVVLILMGLLMTVVIPRFGYMGEGEQLRQTARRLVGMALQCHSDAVTKTRSYFLCFDLDKGSVWLAEVRPDKDSLGSVSSKMFTLPGNVAFTDVIHPVEGMVREGRVSFGYWSQGGNEPGTVHLETEDGDAMTLFIRPYMGRMEIEEGYLREDYS